MEERSRGDWNVFTEEVALVEKGEELEELGRRSFRAMVAFASIVPGSSLVVTSWIHLLRPAAVPLDLR